MIKEFRDFILKGNMLDLAVGVIIGAAFGKVVTAFTEFLLSVITFPTDSTEIGAVEIKKRAFHVMEKVDGKDVDVTKWKVIDLAPIINAFISLIIVGFALFIVVKLYTAAKKRFEAPAVAAAAATPEDVKLLTEIRDLLKSQQGKA
ncbi:large conductance mechanosensitive channel protein MscL [Haloferula sp. BvORR071]|uniref:large conductance mechanosensitive channel protein MscL n=1 Tax=Haloferula sp. BvORR071 TaxID=1396141 RepID=UPI00054F7013|nr:large conductance mechanosensitive channel protein MscL [Haloferula sp. BvORR071]